MLFSGLAFAAPMTNQEASDAGKALGQQQDALITPQINSTTLSTHIQNAKANPTETQFFGGGKADNYLPGDNKRIACDTGTPDPDPYKQQQCNAINLIAKAPSQRPQVEVSRNDPILQREQAVRANASNIVGGAGISNNPNGLGIAGTYSDCTTTTTPDPSPPEIKTCTDFLQATETTEINSCQKSVATTQTCHQIMSFTVTPGATIAGTLACPTGQSRYWASWVISTSPFKTTFSNNVCLINATWATANNQALPWNIDPNTVVDYSKYAPVSTPGWSWTYFSCPAGKYSVTDGMGYFCASRASITCPVGYTLSGTTCVAPPTITETFTDNCATLEAKTK